MEADLELILATVNREHGRLVWREGRAAALAHYIAERPGTRPGPFYLFDVEGGERPFLWKGALVVRDRELMRHLTQPQWLHRRGLLRPTEVQRLSPMAYELDEPRLRLVSSKKGDES